MRLFSALLFAVFLSACSGARPASDLPPLPRECQEGCVTAFGTLLGKSPEGTPAYSNCKPSCVYEKPSFAGEAYTGLEWQCVEFARRWLIQNRGLTFPSIEVAADLWNKVDALEWVSDHGKVALTNILNGAEKLPMNGDILVYAREYMNTGHNAVVLEIDPKRATVRVGEENLRNEKWPGPFSREIPYVRAGGKFWLLDAYLLGWKTYGK